LDAGCGAGIIGISLAASSPEARVVMRDRDILACAFSERNCWRNGIPATRLDSEGGAADPITKRAPKHKNNKERQARLIIAPGLLGEDDPEAPFDFVASNLPAKAGAAILSAFISSSAGRLLNPGGRFAFVIVNTLAGLADSCCASSGLSLVRKAVGKGHTVFILEKPIEASPPAAAGLISIAPDPRGTFLTLYKRTSASRKLGRYMALANGFWGLPEFDTSSFATELALEALEKACAGSLVRDFLIFEPGIGLAALWACKSLGPSTIHAMSRDILALRATRANIEALAGPLPDFQPLQSIDRAKVSDASLDAVLWFPDEVPEYDGIGPDWEFLGRSVKKGGAVVIVSTSTTISRFEKNKPACMQRLGEKKKKGFSAFMARRV